ncbi:hypothetical protein Scep_027572 [Stephania cephalantha]|uniref:Uncharacterized protein n=1 Tax=Stephania cephalantha TaxID=152367 RepID=A0AAP0EAK2_9MAGN
MEDQSSILVHCISKTTITPSSSDGSQRPNTDYLTPWDVAMLSVHYIQKGLLFSTTSSQPHIKPINTIIDELKHSLSLTLSLFYPLAGRLATKTHPYYHVFLDCSSHASGGAEFIHAVADAKVSDLLNTSDGDVHPIFKSFFPLTEPVVNHDGHDLPLLIVQITELIDGVFVGCSFNHVLGDGTSYWNFFNSWAEISRLRSTNSMISREPINNRMAMIKSYRDDDSVTHVNLPYTHHEEFIELYSPPEPLREKMLHFSAKSIAALKVKANLEANTNNISSFQALSALIWRAITRARDLPHDQKTICRLAMNCRSRMWPAWPESYFGNCIQAAGTTAEAGELLERGIGWAARALNETVAGQKDEKVREFLDELVKKSVVYRVSSLFCDAPMVMMGSSPRFDMYGNDFGYWGRPVAARSGYGNKFDGKVSGYPGRDGGGSVDLEVCLFGRYMSNFERDAELLMYID